MISKYCAASGELINTSKSFMILSPNVNSEHKGLLQRVFGMRIEASFGKYLGAPMILVDKKQKSFLS